MIVSRKNRFSWRNLEGASSRLSGPYVGVIYRVNLFKHKLYGNYWIDYCFVNNQNLTIFKNNKVGNY